MENKPPAATSDEIDLGQLFSKIGDFLKNFGLETMRFLALLRRIPLQNKVTFILITIATVVIGLSYSRLLKKNYYESSMILSSDYLNKRLVENSIKKLNLLADEVDKRGLAKALNITDSLARNILEFQAKPFIDENELIEIEVLKEQLKTAQLASKNEKVIDQIIQRIQIENRHAYDITVRTLNPTVINELQTALINYFRNSEYIKHRIEITKRGFLEKKEKLQRDLQRLDSLKAVIYENYKNMALQSKQGSNNVILSDKSVTNPIEVYTQDLELFNQMEDVQRRLYLQPDFEIVDGFTEFSEPSSAGNTKIIGISILIGIFLSYCLVALSHFNRYLANLT
jgi:hypothetical protein